MPSDANRGDARRVETASVTVVFRELVQRAMAAQRVAAGEAAEAYLVALLAGFVRPALPDLLDPPLALDYLQASHLPAWQRYEKLKRVADTALFVTGLFVDSLERSLVGPEYYTALGRGAYTQLSSASRGGLSPLFSELAGRFRDFVRVLAEIGAQDLFRREEDVLRLYKRWLHTRGAREADLLVRRGLIPVAPNTRRRH
jgi:hypothetical protein